MPTLGRVFKENYCIIVLSEEYHNGDVHLIGFTTLVSALNKSEQLSAWIVGDLAVHSDKVILDGEEKTPEWEFVHYNTLCAGKSYGKTLSMKLREKCTANYQFVTKGTFVARLPFLTFDFFLQQRSNLPWNSGGELRIRKIPSTKFCINKIPVQN